MATKIRVGDLFALQLPAGDWLTGRVLLDLENIYRRGLAGRASPFFTRKGCVLVEAYAEPSPTPSDRISTTLIPGMWITRERLTGKHEKSWPIVGYRRVDPREVDFPENVFDTDMGATFEKGEILVGMKGGSRIVDQCNCRTVFQSGGRFVNACNHYAGRLSTIDFSLTTCDLRFSPMRGEVYKRIGVDPTRNYFEWADSLILNPIRLWA